MNFKGFKYFQIYCYRINLDCMKALNVGLSHQVIISIYLKIV